jgi:hypothetical protein
MTIFVETKRYDGNVGNRHKNFSRLLLFQKKRWDDDNNSRMARFFLIVMFNNITEVFQQSFITRTEPLPMIIQDWQNL